ncbi:hypothetical protein [Streptomyces sp. NPDC006645]|uniref:hypothetical protein n=1 Tax=unclassified Streptomyces TaxID=2593676 RepID=UPI0033BB4D3B
MATVLGVILIVIGVGIALVSRLTARTYGKGSTGRQGGIWLLCFAVAVAVASAGFALV